MILWLAFLMLINVIGGIHAANTGHPWSAMWNGFALGILVWPLATRIEKWIGDRGGFRRAFRLTRFRFEHKNPYMDKRCPKCNDPLVIKPDMLFFANKYFPGPVCVRCNSLWKNREFDKWVRHVCDNKVVDFPKGAS